MESSPQVHSEKKFADIRITEPLMCVKIGISLPCYPGIVDDVVYYRYKQPMTLVLRWRWYFDYLCALIKSKHPRRWVYLTICRQEVPCGRDYIDSRVPTLIRGKKAIITKIKNRIIDNDLFSFGINERDEKMARTEEEIKALERGEFNYYVPPTYINKIKEWL